LSSLAERFWRGESLKVVTTEKVREGRHCTWFGGRSGFVSPCPTSTA